MKLTKILCDRCGEYVEAQENYVQIIPRFINANMVSLPIDQLPIWLCEIMNKDFCIDCAHEIIRDALGSTKVNEEFVKAMQKMGQSSSSSLDEKAEDDDCDGTNTDSGEEQIKTRTRIDVGKVMALRKAGWSVKQIAEEFSVSVQAVYMVINKLKEEGRL